MSELIYNKAGVICVIKHIGAYSAVVSEPSLIGWCV